MYNHGPIALGLTPMGLGDVCAVHCPRPMVGVPKSCTICNHMHVVVGSQCIRMIGRWVEGLLLFGCVLGCLGSALGNNVAEHCLASGISSNDHFPIPKVGPF